MQMRQNEQLPIANHKKLQRLLAIAYCWMRWVHKSRSHILKAWAILSLFLPHGMSGAILSHGEEG